MAYGFNLQYIQELNSTEYPVLKITVKRAGVSQTYTVSESLAAVNKWTKQNLGTGIDEVVYNNYATGSSLEILSLTSEDVGADCTITIQTPEEATEDFKKATKTAIPCFFLTVPNELNMRISSAFQNLLVTAVAEPKLYYYEAEWARNEADDVASYDAFANDIGQIVRYPELTAYEGGPTVFESRLITARYQGQGDYAIRIAPHIISALNYKFQVSMEYVVKTGSIVVRGTVSYATPFVPNN